MPDPLDVALAVKRLAQALGLPDHLAQGLHHLVMGLVQRRTMAGEPFHRSADAARLVDADLLGDGQVHRQVQERVGAPFLHVEDSGHGRIHVGQVGVVFRVLADPVGCLGLQGAQELAGLVLGLMMSGRGKYKRLWREEQSAHHHAIRDRDARLNAANERIAELERQSAPIGPGTATAVAGGVQGRDDLSRINGISQTQEVALNEAGYHRYGQIAALNGEQEATLEARLGLKPGTIAHEDWRGQAHDLERGEKPGLLSRLTGHA